MSSSSSSRSRQPHPEDPPRQQGASGLSVSHSQGAIARSMVKSSYSGVYWLSCTRIMAHRRVHRRVHRGSIECNAFHRA